MRWPVRVLEGDFEAGAVDAGHFHLHHEGAGVLGDAGARTHVAALGRLRLRGRLCLGLLRGVLVVILLVIHKS